MNLVWDSGQGGIAELATFSENDIAILKVILQCVIEHYISIL